MSFADEKYAELVTQINKEGQWDYNKQVRTVYPDGTPAYTKSIFGVQIIFEEGEIPILTTKQVFWKTALKEIMLLWQIQTTKKERFHEKGVKIWDYWFTENGDLGTAYSWQFESRPQPTPKFIERRNKKEDEYFSPNKPFIFNSHYSQRWLHFYTEEEINKLCDIWSMIASTSNFDPEWTNFNNFLLDVIYIPQFFLARNDGFEGWVLTEKYYGSNCFSKDTCVWLPHHFLKNYNDNSAQHLLRHELSRNQVIDLINNIKNNPGSRRLMTCFWDDSTIEQKALQECAWATQWNVRGNKLDLLLIQRSADIALGVPFNWIQYWFLQQMIAHATGLKPGRFIHQIGNLHYYDRHEKLLLEQIQRKQHKQPTFVLNTNVSDFFEFIPDDIHLIDYKHEPHIKFDIAI